MEFIVKIAALLVGASLLQEPKACPCSISQDIVISGQQTISLVEYSKSKCILKNDITISVEPNDLFNTQYTVSLWSGDKLLNKQMLTGKSSVTISDDVIVGRRGKAWISIEPSTAGDHLISVSLSRL